MLTRLALLLAYDGTPFRGWTDVRDTVRPTLSKVLRQQEVVVEAASRTDAGVHAAGQVCSLPLERAIRDASELSRLRYSMNQLLPPEVAILRAVEVPASCDVRSTAGKEYRYRLSVADVRDPLARRHEWHVPLTRSSRLKWSEAAVAQAARKLCGTHDFSGFGNTPRGAERAVEVDPVCSLREVSLGRVVGADGEPSASSFELRVVGDRFLYKMVRNIVGALVQVGAGELGEAELIDALRSGKLSSLKQSRSLPSTAPAHGLVLQRVMYAPADDPFADSAGLT